jgi:hypothetical protein
MRNGILARVGVAAVILFAPGGSCSGRRWPWTITASEAAED